MSKMSVWTVMGRGERIGKKCDEQRLKFLHNKRVRQLGRLIEEHKDKLPKKVRRWEEKLAYLS